MVTLKISSSHVYQVSYLNKHLSLPQPFTPEIALISFTNPFLHSLLIPSGLFHGSLTCTELSGHWRFLFTVVSCAR